jgi:Histidine kinase-, DNA gyrase B-, and HSP90-like ATPase
LLALAVDLDAVDALAVGLDVRLVLAVQLLAVEGLLVLAVDLDAMDALAVGLDVRLVLAVLLASVLAVDVVAVEAVAMGSTSRASTVASSSLVQGSHGGRVAHGQGLGLGLFITQQIVTAHGGSIDVASTTEEGTTFTVRMPR